MVWYLVGAALWIVSLLLVIIVYKGENARNSRRAMELEKRFSALQGTLRRLRGGPGVPEDDALPHEHKGTAEP